MNNIKGLFLTLAKPCDVKNIYELILSRVEWFKDNGINQWIEDGYVEFYNEDYYRDIVQKETFYLVKDDDEIVGTILITYNGELWNDDNNAIYINHLTTKVGYFGLGKKLIDFAIKKAIENNKKYVRLDCLQNNKKLNEYYENMGFVCKGNGNIEGEYFYNLRELELKLFKCN